MTRYSIAPHAVLSSLWRHRGLLMGLIRREVIGRYQGSALGLLWSLFNPMLMLAVYTFFFSVVFQARWLGGSNSKAEFALILFAGLLVFNFFAECITRAPLLVVGNVNYVKKIVFPLELLPVVVMGSAAFHLMVSLAVWLIFHLAFFGVPHWTVLLFPLVLLPMFVLTLGVSWILASLGVFLRDVTQVVAALVPLLMFMSPVFYPVKSLPAAYQPLVHLSPVTLAVEQAREVLYWGTVPVWLSWGVYMAVSCLTAWLGYAWFQKTRKGFADVL